MFSDGNLYGIPPALTSRHMYCVCDICMIMYVCMRAFDWPPNVQTITMCRNTISRVCPIAHTTHTHTQIIIIVFLYCHCFMYIPIFSFFPFLNLFLLLPSDETRGPNKTKAYTIFCKQTEKNIFTQFRVWITIVSIDFAVLLQIEWNAFSGKLS